MNNVVDVQSQRASLMAQITPGPPTRRRKRWERFRELDRQYLRVLATGKYYVSKRDVSPQRKRCISRQGSGRSATPPGCRVNSVTEGC